MKIVIAPLLCALVVNANLMGKYTAKIYGQARKKIPQSKGFPNRGDMILNVPIGLI